MQNIILSLKNMEKQWNTAMRMAFALSLIALTTAFARCGSSKSSYPATLTDAQLASSKYRVIGRIDGVDGGRHFLLVEVTPDGYSASTRENPYSFGTFTSRADVSQRSQSVASQTAQTSSVASQSSYNSVDEPEIIPATSSSSGDSYGGDRSAADVYSEITISITSDASLPASGEKTFADYILRNFDRRATTACGTAHGAIKLDFSINSEGRPVSVRVIKSICPSVDRMASRLLTDGPRWISSGSKKAQVEINF